ncbi:MAG: SirB2 family protein [Wenzhouxiangellaceae bacterium]|nr:SirB2 family protein [Wenzhouxiangellaceae bacterium]
MEHYLLLKSLHIALAMVSGLGFALRGFARVVLGVRPRAVWLRRAPHVIDTLLLLSGATLWMLVKFSPIAVPWFGLKLVLIVVYILLGMQALRAKRTHALIYYLAALGVFFIIAWLALSKPLPDYA